MRCDKAFTLKSDNMYFTYYQITTIKLLPGNFNWGTMYDKTIIYCKYMYYNKPRLKTLSRTNKIRIQIKHENLQLCSVRFNTITMALPNMDSQWFESMVLQNMSFQWTLGNFSLTKAKNIAVGGNGQQSTVQYLFSAFDVYYFASAKTMT